MLVDPRIKGFVVEQTKRGLHIGLVIPVDMKSKFDLRKKEKYIGFRNTLGNIAVSINTVLEFPLKEKDTVAFKVEAVKSKRYKKA